MKIRDLFVSIGFDVDDRGLKNLDRGIEGFKTNLRRVAAITAGVGAAVGVFLKYGGEFEQTNVAFSVMLGSAEKAKDLLKDLAGLAMKSPFTLPEVEENAKLLLGMGIEGDKVVETMKALGDVSAGLKVPLWRLALNYGQVKTQGKMTGRELRDFAVAGVPILDELARMLGKSKAQVSDLVEKGKIGFPLVEQAFKNMTSGSGRFSDMMARMANLFFGTLSNIKDLLIGIAREIGLKMLPDATKWAQWILHWLERNRRQIVNLAGDFGKLKQMAIYAAIAIAGVIGVQTLSSIGFMATGIASLIKGFKLLGNVALLTQAKMIALPLLFIGLLAAIVLIFEDIYSYFVGKKSLTGKIFEFFEKDLPKSAGIGLKAFRWLFAWPEQVSKFLATAFVGLEKINDFIVKLGSQQLTRVFILVRDILQLIRDIRKEDVFSLSDTNADGLKGAFSYTPLGWAAGVIKDKLGPFMEKNNFFEEMINKLVVSDRGAPGSQPETYHPIRRVPTDISINAPITVNVPAGMAPANVGEKVKEGVHSAIVDILRSTSTDTAPQVEY